MTATSTKDDGDRSLEGLMDALVDETDGDDVSVGDVLDAIGKRGFGPLLVVVAFIATAPTGAIPGMSILTGTLMILIAVQVLIGREHPWVPGRLERLSIPRDKLEAAVAKGRPAAAWLDRFFGRRLDALADGPMTYVVALVVIAMAATMYPLAVVPFGVTAPGAAVLVLGLALSVKDGVMTLVGLAAAGGALVFAASMVL